MCDRKRERRRLLHQIDLWEPKRCRSCFEGSSYMNKAQMCSCEAAVEIRKLGERYEAIATQTRTERKERLLQQATVDGLNWQLYVRLKDEEVDDRVIAKRLNWSRVRIWEWKKMNVEELG